MATGAQIEHVWNNASTIPGKNPDTWRYESAGNVIRWGPYGTLDEYGRWSVLDGDNRYVESG